MPNDASSQGQLQRSGVQTLKRLITGGPGSGPRKGDTHGAWKQSLSDKRRDRKQKSDAGKEPEKSKNHIMFKGGEEFFTGENGDLFRAPIGNPMDRGYRNGARFESTKAALPLWMKLYGPGSKESKRFRASRIRESYHHSFTEQGQDQGKGKSKNRVYLCTIIEEGLGNSKDKNYYSKEALVSGCKVFEGAKAYADHPDAITEKTLPERSMKDLVGWYSDCVTNTNPATGKTRMQAKIHFFPSAKWLTDMIDTVLTDPSAKNLFGISINAVGRTRPATMTGEEVNYVEEFQRVDSADVVTEPAARGKFEKMLESRRSVAGTHTGKVSKVMKTSRRAREAAVLGPEKLKEVADSLVSAYNSDNPDEMKQSMFEAAQQLHAASSISGKGPGQVNEEQYSNINPSGGKESMRRRTKVKASTGRRSFRKGKVLRAADGTGPDNENVGEPAPSDVEDHLESAREADVEDEEGDTDLGAQDDFGGGSKYRTKEAQEGFEDEDEGFEDEGFEDEDENVGMPAGGGGGGMPGASVGAPAGGGAPGSSRTVAAARDDGDGGDDDDGDDDDDLGDMDEAFEDEGSEDEDEGMEDESEAGMRPGVVSETRNRRPMRRPMMASRGRVRGREASFAGGLGHSGHKALPKGADPTRGYTDQDESYGKVDDSTSGAGKSYKIKTSRFARNKVARRVAQEANRRIEVLESNIMRLRESNKALLRKNDRYKGIVRFTESQKSAHRLLREAVEAEILPEAMATSKTLRESLYGLSEDKQYREIKKTALLLESAQEGTLSRLTESVEGNGARGSVASFVRGTAGAENSELASGFADFGIPMKKE